jgi:hypothetical protein
MSHQFLLKYAHLCASSDTDGTEELIQGRQRETLVDSHAFD